MNLRKGKDYIGVGVGAILLDQEKILLLKRLKKPEAGCWSIPGGAVEFGETLEDAIRRELNEELLIDSEIIAMLGVVNHFLPEERVHWVSPVFLVKIVSGTPKNMECRKHSDLHWFSIKDLPESITLTTKDALRFWHEFSKKCLLK